MPQLILEYLKSSPLAYVLLWSFLFTIIFMNEAFAFFAMLIRVPSLVFVGLFLFLSFAYYAAEVRRWEK